MPAAPSTLTGIEQYVPFYDTLMKNRLPTWRRSTAKWMPQSGSKWRPPQEAKLQVTNLNRAGTSTLSLRGNLRISKSSPGLRNCLPSLCSLGQRVKKLRLLREALTSFVKENTSVSLWLVALTHWPLRKQIAVYSFRVRMSERQDQRIRWIPPHGKLQKRQQLVVLCFVYETRLWEKFF